MLKYWIQCSGGEEEASKLDDRPTGEEGTDGQEDEDQLFIQVASFRGLKPTGVLCENISPLFPKNIY